MRRSLLTALAACACAGALTGCQSWADIRDGVVQPVNQLVHKSYPRAIRSGELEAVMVLYRPGTALAERERREMAALLGRFTSVEHVECVIRDAMAEPDGGERVVTLVDLRVDGTTPEGDRLTLTRSRRLVAGRRADGGEGWELVDAETIGPDAEGRTSAPRFTDEATSRGLTFDNRCRGVIARDGSTQPYHAGSGLAVGDVDGDGHDDILLVGSGDLRLFRNDGTGRFADETAARGVITPETGICRMGVFGDVDGDGDADLFVGVIEGPNLLFRNEGSGRFERVPEAESGLRSSGDTTTACLFDPDGDGDLDLYVGSGGNLHRNTPDPIYDARNGAANQLFENLGDGTFRDVTDAAGVGDVGWTLAVTTVDYDADGDTDLFVANDFGWDSLYRNDGGLQFTEVAREVGIAHRGSSMSAAFDDLDGDGDADLFISGMASNTAWMVEQESFPLPAPWPIALLFRGQIVSIMREMFWGNRTYVNRGDGTFEEVSPTAGSRDAGWGWAAVPIDFDDDGRVDVYNVDGFISNVDPDDL